MVPETGISEQTLDDWKKQGASLRSIYGRELKQLSDENARLTKLVGNTSLDKAVLQHGVSIKFLRQH